MIKWKYKPSGYCPVQAEGFFLKHYFYFRSRGARATIEFCKTEKDWEDWKFVATYCLAETTWPSAGWFSHSYCTRLIWLGCLKFLLFRIEQKFSNPIP